MQTDADEGIAPALVCEAMDALRRRLGRRGVCICIAGVDGSGKTTLARDLVRVLDAPDARVRHLHVYQWYRNILATPWVLLHNRWFGRRVLVFDRSIFDNLAVLAVRPQCPRWMFRSMLAIVRACHPRFDHCLYLVASVQETLRRRPETRIEHFNALRRMYSEITTRVGFVEFESDRHLLSAVLRSITNGR